MERIFGLRPLAAAGARPQPINKGPMIRRRKREQSLLQRNGCMCHFIPETYWRSLGLLILFPYRLFLQPFDLLQMIGPVF